ncbi:hypothetical protein [Maribacter cobaltidurans]|uniref:hypothetical protein n=1 Tax=Maribacter TaxID=252356 RepID=UPI003AF3B5BD|tara:strand:+ start:10484 stop:10726 length:243 start_codon:yes stop_codon:yes gene_type:complete
MLKNTAVRPTIGKTFNRKLDALRVLCPETERNIFMERSDNNSILTWADVIRFTNLGNPTPDGREEKTEEEWKVVLTPEQS